jgi:hypothetical protein
LVAKFATRLRSDSSFCLRLTPESGGRGKHRLPARFAIVPSGQLFALLSTQFEHSMIASHTTVTTPIIVWLLNDWDIPLGERIRHEVSFVPVHSFTAHV